MLVPVPCHLPPVWIYVGALLCGLIPVRDCTSLVLVLRLHNLVCMNSHVTQYL